MSERAELFVMRTGVDPTKWVLIESSEGTSIIVKLQSGDRQCLIEDEKLHREIVELLRESGAEIRKV
ncbi:MAG: hypothetical protein ACXWIU_09290 [Limisphaerales bacterium]